MQSLPFAQLNIKVAFFSFFFIWAVLHFYVLKSFDIDTRSAAFDSIVFNVLLGVFSFVVCNNLGYYKPGKQGYLSLFILCLGLSALLIALNMRIHALLPNDQLRKANILVKSSSIRFATSFLILSCMAMMSILWYGKRDLAEHQKLKDEISEHVREAELFRLQQQLQPHFLFNSLNSIHALIRSNPIEARIMIGQMSEFLRGTMRENSEMVKLADEISHIELYLNIEKVRFGERLKTIIICPEEYHLAQIPSLILQPLLENAIKFGLYGLTGSVLISLTVTGNANEVIISINNPFDDAVPSHSKGSGFGIKSIRRRLYLIYGRNDLLLTKGISAIFHAVLTIPCIRKQNL